MSIPVPPNGCPKLFLLCCRVVNGQRGRRDRGATKKKAPGRSRRPHRRCPSGLGRTPGRLGRPEGKHKQMLRPHRVVIYATKRAAPEAHSQERPILSGVESAPVVEHAATAPNYWQSASSAERDPARITAAGFLASHTIQRNSRALSLASFQARVRNSDRLIEVRLSSLSAMRLASS
jgi:hypothetical protein